MTAPASEGFPTVFGRELVGQLPSFAHRPYLVVTMADLWPRLEAQLSGPHLAGVHLVDSLEVADLEKAVAKLGEFGSVIGVGGGQAVDVAKFFAWTTRKPLFQVPTATTVNAPFGHRAGLRVGGLVRYIGFTIPQAVYIDFDVIASAPPALNRSGIGDILCYHTAHFDWRFAAESGRAEARWPYDDGLVAQARVHLDAVVANLDDIREVTETGIRTLVAGHRWGGTTFHDSGWNPRHIEGMEHFVFYNLERITGRHFIHGQPVGLGIVAASVLQNNDPERMVAAIRRAGVDIRPEAMGVTWDDAAEAMRTLGSYVREAGLWYTVADARPFTDDLIARVRTVVVDAYADVPA
ncbi:MAG TPA: iron-containing alcohol dehydrogenase [Candidatus Limnocylindrales bacterium]|nr:iron-containing alcohol dehydrogenase [Candidatus Limnocylindrales bacterium]